MSDLEQTIVDHDDAEAAHRAAVSAYNEEKAKANPDPDRLAQLFSRMAGLQSQVGELENQL